MNDSFFSKKKYMCEDAGLYNKLNTPRNDPSENLTDAKISDFFEKLIFFKSLKNDQKWSKNDAKWFSGDFVHVLRAKTHFKTIFPHLRNILSQTHMTRLDRKSRFNKKCSKRLKIAQLPSCGACSVWFMGPKPFRESFNESIQRLSPQGFAFKGFDLKIFTSKYSSYSIFYHFASKMVGKAA